jgi:hypothetical protein
MTTGSTALPESRASINDRAQPRTRAGASLARLGTACNPGDDGPSTSLRSSPCVLFAFNRRPNFLAAGGAERATLRCLGRDHVTIGVEGHTHRFSIMATQPDRTDLSERYAEPARDTDFPAKRHSVPLAVAFPNVIGFSACIIAPGLEIREATQADTDRLGELNKTWALNIDDDAHGAVSAFIACYLYRRTTLWSLCRATNP